MISFLRRNRQPFIISFVLIFLIGIFVGLGGYLFTGADTAEAVAVVEGHKLPYVRYASRVDGYLEYMRSKSQEITEATRVEIKKEMLRDMIVGELLAQKADEMGMHVSDKELALSISQTPGFQYEGRFDPQVYFRSVARQYNTTPELYERHQRRDMLSAKLKMLMFRNAKTVPGEVQDEYLRVNAGPLKDFAANSPQFEQQLRQQRALDTINYYLRQRAATADIRTFLDQREGGL